VKRTIWIVLLAAVAFAAIVIARIPAAWILPNGTAGCASLDGSLWSGTCLGLTVSGKPVGDVSWDLHPWRLFGGKLAAAVTLTHGVAEASGDVEVGFGGRITARNVLADLPLDPQLVPGVPPGLHGRAHLELSQVSVQHGIVRELQGRIEAHDLEERSGANTALGSYVISFPGGSGDPIGKIRDLDGPLAVEGTLHLTAAPGFELEGFVAPRQGASPEVVNNLRFFGSPDATGRREFSMSGTF
jgi:hypothetical protein